MSLPGFARVAIKVALLIAVVAFLRLYVFEHYVDQQQIKSLIDRQGVLAPVVFTAIVFLTAVVYLPSALMVGLGAISFGILRGPLLSLMGLTLGACLAFLIGRYTAREAAEDLLQRRFKRFRRFYTWTGSNEFPFVLSLRLTSFFDTATNYVLGTTRVGFWNLLAGTVVGFVPPVYLVSFSFEVIWKAQTVKQMTICNPYVWCLPLLRALGIFLLASLSRQREVPKACPAGEQETAGGQAP
jgi:uncharacterized membrane protein YdjX (TVP38/TMEM64 family)